MKRLFLIALAILTVAAPLRAQDQVAVGKLITKYGATVLVAYIVTGGSYDEVHLFWPDGHQTGIAVPADLASQTVVKGLQRFIDAQTPVCTP